MTKAQIGASITLVLAVLGGLFSLSSSPAEAVTAGDVVGKMSKEERYGYLSGAIDMAMFMHSQNGGGAKAECIMGWFYKDKKSGEEIAALFDSNKARPAIGLLHVLIGRHCK